MRSIQIDDKIDAAFYSDIEREDALGVVVRGLMYIEAELAALIEENVSQPDTLSRDIEFAMRVRIAVALGLRASLLPPLNALGNLRNKLAHNLRVSLGQSVANNLYKTLESVDQEIVQVTYRGFQERSDGKYPSKFKDLDPLDQVRFFLVTLRMAVRAARMQSDTGRVRIQAALDATGQGARA